MTKQVMAGIDLHSNNLMIGIVDQSGKRLKHQKVGCDLKDGFPSVVVRFANGGSATNIMEARLHRLNSQK